MHDDFASLFAYNHWADRRILDACRLLSPEQYAAEPVPGWSSVRATVVHLTAATEGWLRGLAGETGGTSPPRPICRPRTPPPGGSTRPMRRSSGYVPQ